MTPTATKVNRKKFWQLPRLNWHVSSPIWTFFAPSGPSSQWKFNSLKFFQPQGCRHSWLWIFVPNSWSCLEFWQLTQIYFLEVEYHNILWQLDINGQHGSSSAWQILISRLSSYGWWPVDEPLTPFSISSQALQPVAVALLQLPHLDQGFPVCQASCWPDSEQSSRQAVA